MKRILLSWTIVCVSAILFSCKKEAAKLPAVLPIQPGAVEEFIKNENPKSASDGKTYELGVAFTSLVRGEIKSFKLHLPEEGNYLVTLWKVDDHSIIVSSQVINSNTEGWNDTPLSNTFIEANTSYILSVNTKVFYYFEASSKTFPFTKGAITITGYEGKIGAEQIFPDLLLSATPAGFVDFTFQPSE